MNHFAKYGFCAWLLVLACSACIRVEHDLTLNDDGSGRLLLDYGVSEMRIADMEAFAELSGLKQGDGGRYESPLKHFNEQSIRNLFLEHEQHGVSLLSLASRAEDDWTFMRLEIGFESLTGLANAGFLDPRSVSLRETKTGEFLYSVRPNAGGGPAAGPLASRPDLAEEFRLQITVRLPGDIVETNGRQLSDRSVTWRLDGADGVASMSPSASGNLHALFRAPGATLPPFGQMRIRLKPPKTNAQGSP